MDDYNNCHNHSEPSRDWLLKISVLQYRLNRRRVRSIMRAVVPAHEIARVIDHPHTGRNRLFLIELTSGARALAKQCGSREAAQAEISAYSSLTESELVMEPLLVLPDIDTVLFRIAPNSQDLEKLARTRSLAVAHIVFSVAVRMHRVCELGTRSVDSDRKGMAEFGASEDMLPDDAPLGFWEASRTLWPVIEDTSIPSHVDWIDVFSHNDIKLDNILVTESGPVLIDWELSGPAPIGWDMACFIGAMLRACICDRRDPKAAESQAKISTVMSLGSQLIDHYKMSCESSGMLCPSRQVLGRGVAHYVAWWLLLECQKKPWLDELDRALIKATEVLAYRGI